MMMYHGLPDRSDGRQRRQVIVGFGNLRTGPAESPQQAGGKGERDGRSNVSGNRPLPPVIVVSDNSIHRIKRSSHEVRGQFGEFVSPFASVPTFFSSGLFE